jgi:hypothetical protein
MNQNGERTQR